MTTKSALWASIIKTQGLWNLGKCCSYCFLKHASVWVRAIYIAFQVLIFHTTFRSSHSEVFLGKGVLKICSKFTGEHPCQSTILIKFLCNFIEIALRHGYSSVNCCIFSEHLFSITPLSGCFWTFIERT